MTLLNVTVTGNLGPAAAGARGYWQPTGWLTDAPDELVLPPFPLPPFTIAADGTFTSGPLLAQDSPGPQPAGEAWQLTITDLPGGLPDFVQTYTILHANGATQDLSRLATAVASPVFTNYMTLLYPPGAGADKVWSSDSAGNGSWESLAALGVDMLPAATEQVIYVSAAASASDASSGLSPGEPKATIAGALTALGGRAGIVQLGIGTFPITAADGNGNGVTLTAGATKLRGCGAGITILAVSTTVAWGVQCQAGLCEVSDLEVRFVSGGSGTYGVGVDTPGATGSAEACRFWRLKVDSIGGSHAYSFAVGPSHTGSGTVDIAATSFWDCTGISPTQAPWLVGNGTPGNILGTHCYGCQALSSQYGVRLAAGDITWYGGGFGENTNADIRVESSNGAPIVVSGFRSEGGARLLSSSQVATPATVAIRDATWISGDGSISAAGDVINHLTCGTLTLDSVNILNLGSTVPVFIVGNPFGQSTVALRGCAVSAPMATLLSGTPAGNVSATVENYVPLNGSGGFAGPAIAGPVRLGPSNVTTNYNGTVRDTLSPTETILLSSAGAVAIAGTCPVADITLRANASSCTVASLYLGQQIIIAFRQDSTGGRTYAWPAICKFRGGTPPTPSTAANAVDCAAFWYDGASLIQF